MTNSFLRLEELKSNVERAPRAFASPVIEQYQSMMALKDDIAEGIEIPVAMSANMVSPLAAQPMAQTASVQGIITQPAQSGASDNDMLLKERESYYGRLISLVKNREESVSAALKASYESRLGDLKKSFDAEISAYEQRIAEIDELLKTGERSDADAEYNDKMLRLSELLKYENDAGNRYELEKEMAALTKDYEKRKTQESLYDERSALTELASAAKAAYADRKAAMQDAMAVETEAVRRGYAEQIESLTDKMNSELDLIKKAQAEKDAVAEKGQLQFSQMLNSRLNMQREFTAREYLLLSNAQSGVISMLYSRLYEFAAAGSALGASFSYAFESHMAIIQARIDSLRAQLAALGGDAGGAAAQSTSYVFNQTITSTAASPSEIARDTKNLLENAVHYA